MPWDPETARAYDELGEQRHVAVLGPLIGELLGDLEGCRVLDFGCGPGRLTVRLAEAGAARVTAVDEQPQMVARARATVAAQSPALQRRVEVRRGSETEVPDLGPFEVVFSSLVLMMAASRERLGTTCRTLVGSLVPGGRLLAVVTHPCFRRQSYRTFHYELPEDYDYWRSGTPYDVVLTPEASGGDAPVITDYHWRLEDYCSAFADAGAVVVRLCELPATRAADGSPQGPPAYLAMLLRAAEPAAVGG